VDIPSATNFLTSEAYKAQQEAKLFSNEESLGRDAFLTLFTTQLKNQNPLDPLENEAFVAQLAQFSSLEAMKGMQSSLEDVSSNLRNEQFLVGASLLGKSVSLESGLVTAAKMPKGLLNSMMVWIR
jgi:flagellar basal-body rod modification protein FlgD